MHVTFLMWYFSCVIFHVTFFMWHFSCVIFQVTFFMSHFYCHMFHVIFLMWHVSCDLFNVTWSVMWHFAGNILYVTCHMTCHIIADTLYYRYSILNTWYSTRLTCSIHDRKIIKFIKKNFNIKLHSRTKSIFFTSWIDSNAVPPNVPHLENCMPALLTNSM